MKNFIGIALVSFMVLVAVPAQAQINFGVKGGVNIASVHFNDDIIDADNITGFNIGPMVEIMAPYLGVGVDAAILYSQKGAKFKGSSESYTTDYIDVPVNFKWKFGIPVIKGYFAAGPYASFKVGGDKIWDIPDNISTKVKTKSFGAGLNIGLGAEILSHLQVGFNYGLGLTNNYSGEGDSGIEGKHRGWAITAAILF